MEKLFSSKELVINPYRFLGTYRALLALLVLVSHSSMWLPDWVAPLALGNVGVFSFFVLSGFVIAEACDIFYPGTPHRFLLNRFLRIYPTYWAVCGVAIAIYISIPHPEFNSSNYSIFANLTIILGERLPSNEFRLLSLIWAVGIELRFYIVAAIITYADHLLSHRKILKSGWIIFFSGLILLILYFVALMTDFNRISVIKFMPFFALGFVYYRWLKYRSSGSIFIGVLMLFSSVQSYIIYNSASVKTSLFETTIIFGVALLLFAGLVFVTKVHSTLEQIDKRLGDLTYSIYLVHWPIVYAVSRSNLEGFESFFTVFICSVVASILIYLMVEKPIFKLRDSIRRTRLYS